MGSVTVSQRRCSAAHQPATQGLIAHRLPEGIVGGLHETEDPPPYLFPPIPSPPPSHSAGTPMSNASSTLNQARSIAI